MDLMYYLTQKPITAYFCPYCFKWHSVSGTIADAFKGGPESDSLVVFCHNEFETQPERTGSIIMRTSSHYQISFKNGTLYFRGDTFIGNIKCLGNVFPIEGSISINDIANNFVLSKFNHTSGNFGLCTIDKNYLDIFFHIDCHPPFTCSKCDIYGPEEYFYKCKDFERIMTQNVLYYREHDIRPHYPILLGLRYEVKEGEPIFNIDKLYRVYILLKRKFVLSQSHISVMKRQIYMLQKYVLKDENELQALDTINKELETLLSKLVKLNRKVSKLYGEPEDSIGNPKEYDADFKIRYQALRELYPSMDDEDYQRRYGIYQRKVRDYIEQKAAGILKIYEGIQSELSTIEYRIDNISKTLNQVQHRHSLEF